MMRSPERDDPLITVAPRPDYGIELLSHFDRGEGAIFGVSPRMCVRNRSPVEQVFHVAKVEPSLGQHPLPLRLVPFGTSVNVGNLCTQHKRMREVLASVTGPC